LVILYKKKSVAAATEFGCSGGFAKSPEFGERPTDRQIKTIQIQISNIVLQRTVTILIQILTDSPENR
jgi:hypothetical protein